MQSGEKAAEPKAGENPATDADIETPAPGIPEEEEKFVKSLRALTGTIDKMVKAANTYSENHPAVQGFFKEIHETFTRLLAEREELSFDVAQFVLYHGPETIYENTDPKKSLAFSFYKDGIRKITFLAGLTADEVRRFCRLLRNQIGIQSTDDDFVTLIWDEGFGNIKIDAQDDMVIENAVFVDEDPIESAKRRIEERTDESFKALVEEQRRKVLEAARTGDRIVKVAPGLNDEDLEGPVPTGAPETGEREENPAEASAGEPGAVPPASAAILEGEEEPAASEAAAQAAQDEGAGEPAEEIPPLEEQISSGYVKDLFSQGIAGLNAEEWADALFLDEAGAKELLAAMEQEHSRDLREYVFKIVLEVLEREESSRVLDELIEYVSRFLEDTIKEGRFDEAARALGELITVPISNEDMRILISQILYRLGEPEILGRIINLLNHGYRGTTDDVLFVLSHLSRNAIVPLVRLSPSVSNRELRRVLERVIVMISASAIDDLGGMVREENWLLVRNVVRILGELADPRAVSYLMRTIRHPETMVRLETIQALGRIEDQRVPSVLAALLADTETSVRTQVLRTLPRFDNPKVLETLTRIVLSPEFEDRMLAEKRETFHALVQLPRQKGIAFLEKLFHIEQVESRSAEKGFFKRFFRPSRSTRDTLEIEGPDGSMTLLERARAPELRLLAAQALAGQGNREAGAYFTMNRPPSGWEEAGEGKPAWAETASGNRG